MQYRIGIEFEKAVFGGHSGRNLFRRFGRDLTNFGTDLRDFIQSSGIQFPPTEIGECLYSQVVIQLDHLGIDPEELVFIPSVDTKVDLYGVDGLFFLPSLFPHLVTVDTFNIETARLFRLRKNWIDEFIGDFYSNENFQSDMFLHKKGMAEWKKSGGSLAEAYFLTKSPDYRQYAKSGRPENHFLLTPYHVGKKREFAKTGGWILCQGGEGIQPRKYGSARPLGAHLRFTRMGS